jgi:hypothetical protein
MWTYPTEFLEALAAHGLMPTPLTPPARVRAAVTDLYRFELRRARERVRARPLDKSHYFDIVVSLRRKYWVLTLPPDAWERICAEGSPVT